MYTGLVSEHPSTVWCTMFKDVGGGHLYNATLQFWLINVLNSVWISQVRASED
jgi:hypothetical protein